ncbi:thioredoxin fold domain-containing protein, partial [Klebsiella pneumoniae]
ANDAQDMALLKHLNVLGLPTILFFDGQGQEHPQARVTGFMDAETFSAHLRDRQP